VKKLKELEEDLMNNQQQQQQQEYVRVGSAHWLPPPTRHSMQDISSSTAAATRPSSLDHTQSMPNLEVNKPFLFYNSFDVTAARLPRARIRETNVYGNVYSMGGGSHVGLDPVFVYLLT